VHGIQYTLTQCTVYSIPSHSARYTVYPHTVHGILYTLTQCTVYSIPSHSARYTVYPHTMHGTQCTLTQCTAHTPHRSQYAAITLTTSCTTSTYLLVTKCVILAKY